MATWNRKFVFVLFFLLLISCGGADSESETTTAEPATSPLPTETPAPTAMVGPTVLSTVVETDVTGETVPTLDFSGLVETAHGPMYIQCSGQGEGPVVILEAGLGNNATTWRLVEREVEAFGRVCSYNRLIGPGPDGEDRTAKLAAEELHMLLETAEIPGPYILVGHSYGGFIIRLYTDLYPDEVVGLVFVDSSHEEQRQRMNDVMTPEEQEENGKRNRPNVNGVDFVASGLQVGETGGFGDRPVLVLTRGEWQTGLSFITAETEERMYQEWIAMHSELAALSTVSEQWFALESGHNVHLDEPELVVEGIRWVLEMIE